MKAAWINHILKLSKTPADLYCGSRKIIRNTSLTFPWECDLVMADAGYTASKMKQLERNYLHPESIAAAVSLWNEYRSKPKYRSVSFTTYNHFIKDHKGPRGSKMGPCIQSVAITMLNRKEADINVFYRTTELLKKFPADLIFLKERLLTDFNFDGMTIKGIHCFFANITVHPAYWVTAISHMEDPIFELERIRKADKYFFEWICKWTARYLIEKYGHGIAKFSQAVRVQMHAHKSIIGEERDTLVAYLEKWHPGYHRTRFDHEEIPKETDEDEE